VKNILTKEECDNSSPRTSRGVSLALESMKVLRSIVKQDFTFDTELLYAFRNSSLHLNIERIDLKTFNSLGEFSIKSSVFGNAYPIVDDNCIYFVDRDSNLMIIDKMSGEVFNKIPLKSICIASIKQDNDNIYILSLLPTNVEAIRFSTYFVQKINKETGDIVKFSFHHGIPTRKIELVENNIFLSDFQHLLCLSIDGNEKWSISLRSKMNNPIEINEKLIVTSSTNGAVQGFDIKTGENKFNIQMIASKASPFFGSKWIWFNKGLAYVVDLERVCNRISGWQEHVEFPISSISCGIVKDGIIIVGNFAGQIATNNGETIHIGRQPVLSFDEINSHIVCESASQISFLET